MSAGWPLCKWTEDRKCGRKEGKILCSLKTVEWIQEYSGMFLLGSLLSLWFSSAAGSLLTPGLLVWWMTLWHYFSPERHWGPGCPCPGYETFLWVCLYRKRRHDKFNESTRSCWACSARPEEGGAECSTGLRLRHQKPAALLTEKIFTTFIPGVLFLSKTLLHQAQSERQK